MNLELSTETERIGKKRTDEDDPDSSIIKIHQNTEKIPKDLRRSAVSQRPLTTGWVSWSTRRCATDLNLTIRMNGICTTQHLSKRMTHIHSYGILTFKRITLSHPEDHNNQQTKKKIIWKVVDFGVPADHRIKLKEWEKKDKYHDFAGELKNLWKIKVAIILIVIAVFGTII